MITVILQLLLAIGALAFGVASLRVALTVRADPHFQAAAWGLTGTAFTLAGITGVIQTTWAAVAFFSDVDSAVYRAYLNISPIGNHARAFLIIAFAFVLLALVLRRTAPTVTFWVTAGLALGAGLSAGAFLGWREGTMNYGSHFTSVAFLNAVLIWVLLGALFRALFTTMVDRLLWGALASYSIYQVFGVVWTTAVVMRDVPGAWTPPPRILYLLGLGFYVGMLVQAHRRLKLARQGVSVPNLLGDSSVASFSAF